MENTILRNELFIQLSRFQRIASSYKLTTNEAKKHLNRGINYRYILIQDSLLLLENSIEQLPNNRYEIGKINIAINSVYINLRGIIDNIAWIIYYEFIKNGLNKNCVSLAHPAFQKKLKGTALYDILTQKYKEWFCELKALRDPIAHQLPLYIPPKIITNENDAKLAQEYINMAERAIQEGNRDEWYKYLDEYSKIGKFSLVLFIDSVEPMKLKPINLKEELYKDFSNLASLGYDVFNNSYK
jgi:hypothetical protein